jgi:hypothetical protein
MPISMIYGSHVYSYASYTHGLWSGLTEWIIWWRMCKRKSQTVYLFRGMNVFSFSILPITHAYNVGISWFQSYVRLRSEDMTPIIYPNSEWHHNSGWWPCRMSYHLSCERHRVARLDDCSILHAKHLVRSRLGGMHDLISVQNLSISWLHMPK